jgi:signal transduction histidine kinase
MGLHGMILLPLHYPMDNNKSTEPKASQPLAEQAVDFERVFRSAPDPYLLISPDLTMLSASDSFLKVATRSYEHIAGKYIFETFPQNPNDTNGTGVANVRNAIETVFATGKMHSMPEQKYDVQMPGTDKFAVKYWLPTHHPVLDNDGRVIYVLQRPIDITDEVINREKIKELETEKEQLIVEQFSWMMSHDLREPLRKISIYLDMLDKEPSVAHDAVIKKYEGYVRDGVKKMNNLLNDVQQFAQLWKAPDTSIQVDLNKTIEWVKQALSTQIAATEAVIVADKLPEVLSHPHHMQVLFKNLVENALKFRRKDVTPKVEIGVRKRHRQWVFYVKDNGVGISPAYHKKIFTMLQRLHMGYEGTGIGLATCKKIVEMNGGKMHVQSTLGKGSTFFFTLPCRKQHGQLHPDICPEED